MEKFEPRTVRSWVDVSASIIYYDCMVIVPCSSCWCNIAHLVSLLYRQTLCLFNGNQHTTLHLPSLLYSTTVSIVVLDESAQQR